MATRPLVSYDDITLPYQPTKLSFHQQHRQHPPKKRKKKSKHCDDSSTHSNYYSNGVSNGNGNSGSISTPFQEEGEVSMLDAAPADDDNKEEESRELTHEEIWDDSALVNAWEAATDEYKAYHGSDKAWKTEPVNKAPLWYNVPVESSSKSTSSTKDMAFAIPAAIEGGAENDSQPINFDTFVPTHNPSLDQLSSLAPLMDYAQDSPSATMVSQDEAFSHALNAMYWGGYWTAVYHCQRNILRTNIPSAEDDLADENDNDIEDLDAEGVEDDEFISTQR